MISDWGDLQTILSIARNGSLSAAARQLGLSQSTLSRRLQAIETRLDRQLFERGADGRFIANDTGAILIAAATRMNEDFEKANLALTGVRMPIRLASCEVVAKSIVMPMLSAWTTQNGAQVELGVYDNLFDLPSADFDVLVTPLESAPDDMIGRHIGNIQWGLYRARNARFSTTNSDCESGLDGFAVIRASGSLAEIGVYRWFTELGGSVALSASSPMAMMEGCRQGTGIALLPRGLADGDDRLERLDVASPPASHVWILVRKATARQRRVRQFLNFAYGHFKRESKAA